jgi:hypothetical protein
MLWLITFMVMMLVVAGMAVGVMAGRKPIAGSCGGIGATGIESSCTLCGGNPQKCEESSRAPEAAARGSFYDASAKK